MSRPRSIPGARSKALSLVCADPSASVELAAIPRVGPKRVAAYAAIGITTLRALVLQLPIRYRERLRPTSIAALLEHTLGAGEPWALGGTIMRYRSGRRRGSPTRLEIADDSGTLETLSFALRRVPSTLRRGTAVYLLGRASVVAGRTVFVFDHYEVIDSEEPPLSHLPLYDLPQGIPQRVHRAAVRFVLESIRPPGLGLDEWGREPQPCSLLDAIEIAHSPRSAAQLEVARRRLAFEELATSVLPVLERRRAAREREKHERVAIAADARRAWLARLPFRATAGQIAAFDEICDDLERSAPMHRLLHGEVGAGKTVVAVLAALAVVAAGRQAALLAPTTLLAEQLAAVARALAVDPDRDVGSFTGATPTAQRRLIAQRLRAGDSLVLIGTLRTASALNQAPRLGLVIIDEQHRFGVAQRARLRSRPDVDLLVMSATPIPRSLALTLYGDLELSVLRELPPGRCAVETQILEAAPSSGASAVGQPTNLDVAIERIAEECRAGGTVFAICPQITASERTQWSTLAIEAELRARGIRGIEVAHGRRSPAENERALAALRAGAARVLVATTVIEVGIDVQRATLIVVLAAEHFGLAQLHQLRGRVGRGTRAGRCLLVPSSADPVARVRLERFAATLSGFEVAELDLETRGAGEIAGLEQHGALDLRFARLPRDLDLLLAARTDLSALLESRTPGNRPQLPILIARTVSGPG